MIAASGEIPRPPSSGGVDEVLANPDPTDIAIFLRGA